MDQPLLNVVGVIVAALIFYFVLWKPLREHSQETKSASQRLAGSDDPAVVKMTMRRLADLGAQLDSYLQPEVRHLQKKLPGVVRDIGGRSPWQTNFAAQGAAISHLTAKAIQYSHEKGLSSDAAFLWEAAVRTTDKVAETLSLTPSEVSAQFLESVAAALEEEFEVDFDNFLDD